MQSGCYVKRPKIKQEGLAKHKELMSDHSMQSQRVPSPSRTGSRPRITSRSALRFVDFTHVRNFYDFQQFLERANSKRSSEYQDWREVLRSAVALLYAETA